MQNKKEKATNKERREKQHDKRKGLPNITRGSETEGETVRDDVKNDSLSCRFCDS